MRPGPRRKEATMRVYRPEPLAGAAQGSCSASGEKATRDDERKGVESERSASRTRPPKPSAGR
jgi:hypothetical protein